MPLLVMLLSNWRMVAAGLGILALVAVGAFIRHQATENDLLRENLSTVEKTAIANARALDQYRAQAARDMAAVTADRDAAIKRLNNLAKIRKDIANAPDSEDGPAGILLDRTIDSLQQPRDPGQSGR